MTRLRAITKRAGLSVFTILYSAFVAGPLVWLLDSSLRSTQAIISKPVGVPTHLDWRNYATLLGDHQFWQGYMNSGIVVGGAILLILLTSSMAGYGFARFTFRGRELMYAAIYVGMLLPPQLVIVPLFMELRNFNLVNDRLGLILVYTAFALPVSVYILRRFFQQLPESIAESARIDGASEWTVFWRIMLPMSRPAVFTVMVLQFVLLWNEYVLALIILEQPSLMTLPVALSMLAGEYSSNIGAMAAGLLMSILPLIIGFLILSDRFLTAMTSGAVR